MNVEKTCISDNFSLMEKTDVEIARSNLIKQNQRSEAIRFSEILISPHIERLAPIWLEATIPKS